MKRIALILSVGLFLMTSCVYESGVSEAYSKYRFKDGVTTVSVPGWVIHLAAGIGDLEESERDLLKSIDGVKVIAVEDNNLNARIDLHEEFYKKNQREEGLRAAYGCSGGRSERNHFWPYG